MTTCQPRIRSLGDLILNLTFVLRISDGREITWLIRGPRHFPSENSRFPAITRAATEHAKTAQNSSQTTRSTKLSYAPNRAKLLSRLGRSRSRALSVLLGRMEHGGVDLLTALRTTFEASIRTHCARRVTP